MTINIFQRRRAIAETVAQTASQTLNQIAQSLGISPSSVWRHQTARQALADTPVAAFWSSAPGMDYLIRVMVAVFYCFGIKHGVGAESLSEFFRLIGLDSHVATSPSALRTFKTRLVELIEQYGTQQQERLKPPADKTVIVGGDETFFEVPILVLMELASGYLFFETAQPSRSFERWSEAVDGVELPDGWRIRAMVSDGAKALVKLAVERLQCVHLPDVFHLLRNLGQPWVRALGREHQRLEREAKTLAERQDKRRSAPQQTAYEAQVHQHQVQAATLAQNQRVYQQAMNTITTALHPFNLHTGEGQHWDGLERQLHDPLMQLETLAQCLSLSQGPQTIETFRAHLPSLAHGVNLWWHGVLEDLALKSHDPLMHSWVLSALLPAVYWQQQAQKTRTPALRAIYQQAAQHAERTLNAHPFSAELTPDDYHDWGEWGQQHCSLFQRTSSAIEGRNGQLSRLHHATRGFSPELLQALSIIHNFDTRRADGSTPAERLFEQSFPDLFEWLVGQVQGLPLPRKSKKSQPPQPLPSLDFSA